MEVPCVLLTGLFCQTQPQVTTQQDTEIESEMLQNISFGYLTSNVSSVYQRSEFT